MKSVQVETVALKKLRANLYVRMVLDQDHILYLAELIANKVAVSTS